MTRTKTLSFLPRIAGIALTLVAPTIAAFIAPQPALAQMNPALQMALGNPDHSRQPRLGSQRLLIQRPQYALDFDNTLHFPIWVSWHLGKADIGSVGRGQFVPDDAMSKAGFVEITPADYTRSGYDRGHNCPSADRSASSDDNDAVFLMSNITPQAHGMNAGPWEKLEIYSRQLAQAGNDLYIYCGHGFSAPTHGTIGPNKVAVPDFGWKIVVVVPSGSGDPTKKIAANTRVIAVRMPNINTISQNDWRPYRTSVAAIEKATGLVFFDKIPKRVASALKNRVDADSIGATTTATNPAPAIPTARVSGGTVTPPTAPANSAQVWVNTRSGAYWRPGTEYYGKTKQGKYMSEADAIAAGYHAAGGQ